MNLKTKPFDMNQKNSVVLNGVRERLWRKNQNWLCCLTGQTGTGKSYSALSMAKYIDKDFSIDRVCFTAGEFMELINSGKLKRGHMIVFDEAGVGFGARNWMREINKNFSFILQTFRYLNHGVIFTVPSFDFVDIHGRRLFHCYGETLNIDYTRRLVRVKLQNLQYNAMTHTLYRKYPRKRLNSGKIVRIPYILVSEPDKELRQAYEEKKRMFTTALNKRIQQDIAPIVKTDKPATKKELIARDLIKGRLKLRDIAKKHDVSYRYVIEVKASQK